MKRKMTISIALMFGLVVLSVLGSDSTSQAQNQDRHGADTGFVTLGPTQILRVTVVNRSKADLNVRFGRIEYSQGTCNGGVCKHLQTNINNEIAAVTLAPTEAASMDISNTSFGVRGVVFLQTNLNNESASVVAQIIDSQTGMVSTGWDVLMF